MKLEHWINSDFQADHVPNPTKEPKLDFQQVKKSSGEEVCTSVQRRGNAASAVESMLKWHVSVLYWLITK